MRRPRCHPVWRRHATFDGATGALITPDLDAANAPPLALYATMTPLPYGNFGGLFVRKLYFVLGVVITFAIGAGFVLWIDKRRGRHAVLAKAAIGSSVGCVVATALVFPLDLWLRHYPETRFAGLESALWLAWLLTLIAAFVQSTWSKALIVGLNLSAVLFAAAGLISTVMVTAGGDAATRPGQVALAVDVALIGLAVLCRLSAVWTRSTVESGAASGALPAPAAS